MYTLWLIHVDIWHKPTQYCKAIILQLKTNNFLKDLLPKLASSLVSEQPHHWQFLSDLKHIYEVLRYYEFSHVRLLHLSNLAPPSPQLLPRFRPSSPSTQLLSSHLSCIHSCASFQSHTITLVSLLSPECKSHQTYPWPQSHGSPLLTG